MANNKLMNMQGQIIGIADIMFATTGANSSTANANGSVTLNLGLAESGEMDSQQAELWSSPGIISVPLLPKSTNNNTDAAQGIFYNHSDQNIVFAVRDTRSQQLAGNINPGETCVYAPSGQARVLAKADGSITLMTTDDNTDAGNNVYLRLAPDRLEFKSPWGKITFDQTGFHVANSTGARIDLGGLNAPAPLDTLIGSYAKISAGIITIDSGNINLGPSTGAYLPAIYGVLPVVGPGIPILGAGTGVVTVAAAASTSVNISV